VSLDSHVVIDRRALKRRIGFWRASFFVCIAFICVASLLGLLRISQTQYIGHTRGWSYSNISYPGGRSYIAEFRLFGLIKQDPAFTKTVKKVIKDKRVKGVIVTIDSPGGSASDGEAIYEVIRDLAEKKPTVARMERIAASAGYLIALGADHVIARRNSLTGSIGVLFTWPDLSGLAKKLGVKFETIKSSPMKGEPSPFNPISPSARKMHKLTIADVHDWFVKLVAERRGLSVKVVRRLADGRVVSGMRAKNLKLVDELGGEKAALDWLASRKVDPETKIVTVYPKEDLFSLKKLFSRDSMQLNITELVMSLFGGGVLEARMLDESVTQ